MVRISKRKAEEIAKLHEEQRRALISSINDKETFASRLIEVVQALEAPGGAYTQDSLSNFFNLQHILLRGHQILDPDEYWEAVDQAGLDRQTATEIVREEIRSATALSIDEPFVDYVMDILTRGGKLARAMQAGTYNQEIFSLRSTSLKLEAEAALTLWESQRQDDGMPTVASYKKICADAFELLDLCKEDRE